MTTSTIKLVSVLQVSLKDQMETVFKTTVKLILIVHNANYYLGDLFALNVFLQVLEL